MSPADPTPDWTYNLEYFPDTHEILASLRTTQRPTAEMALDDVHVLILRRFHVPNPKWVRVRSRGSADGTSDDIKTHNDQSKWRRFIPKELVDEVTEIARDLHNEMCADAPEAQDDAAVPSPADETFGGPSARAIIESRLGHFEGPSNKEGAPAQPRRRIARPLYPLAARIDDAWTLIRPISQYWYRKPQWEFVDPWRPEQEDLHPRIREFIEHSQDCPLYVFQLESRRDYARLVEYPPTGARILVMLHPEAAIIRTSDGVELVPQKVVNISEYDAYEVTLEDGDAVYVAFRDDEIVLTPIEPPTLTGDCYREDATNEYVVFRPWIRVAFPVPLEAWRLDISSTTELDEDEPEISVEAEPEAAEARIDLSNLAPGKYRAAIVTEEEGTVAHIDFHWRPDVLAIKRDILRYLPSPSGHGSWAVEIVTKTGTERMALDPGPSNDEIVYEFESGNPQSQHVFHAPRTWWRWVDANGRTEYTDWPLDIKRSQVVPYTRIELRIPWTKRRADVAVIAFPWNGRGQPSATDYQQLAIKRGRSNYWRIKTSQLAATLNTLGEGDSLLVAIQLEDETCTLARIFVDNDTFHQFPIEEDTESEEDDEESPTPTLARIIEAAPTIVPLELNQIQWRTTSEDGVLDQWNEAVLLRPEDLSPTSETSIEIRIPSPRPHLELNVGGAGLRRIYPETGGTVFFVQTRTLSPPEQSIAIQGRVAVSVGLGPAQLKVAEIAASMSGRKSRWQGFHFRKIRDLDLVEFHQVAHAAEKGAKFADHFKDRSLAQLFREIYTDSRHLALEGEMATTRWEEEQLRQVLVCLYELLYATYLFNVDYSQSRELRKWIRAARDNVKHLAPLYEQTREEYEKLLAGGQ